MLYTSIWYLPQVSLKFPFLISSGLNQITVLIWWEPFGKKVKTEDCQVLFNISGCRVTTDRYLYEYAHAVLFHSRDINIFDLPVGKRPTFQRWIWMNFESPTNSFGLEELGGMFNWTMSYKMGSDIFIPYGYLYPKKQETVKIILPRKRKLVAWVISNWSEEHARTKYYYELSHYIDIDIYGRYGMQLKHNDIIKTVSEYKFYLTFENSQHPDYITEKLWRNAFKSSAVPIVLGPSRSNYEMFIPPDSFIHVDDFSSPKSLAKYLRFLDKNVHIYRRYFFWKRRFDVHVASFWNEHFCTVCQAVRAAGDQRKTIPYLDMWFNS
ncbi:alpha-(1,3)-fucosyltransferase 4 [Latimeria chalumnae]|uniref:alpha-(1,3)-fucosyltransferase 4 n=1 Tax=Latimeria chalumnae TaxID=7897 RepID=UPI0003C15CC3|nr:PREDICTED: alpha-(1,3)-fucosyltransferase 4 [Latimeria chalumnae]|eukprot:XP_006000732.1 PREDICTED: alpha-(1,3)-fucosyltransferase 4 [Latimeria chalumnae]